MVFVEWLQIIPVLLRIDLGLSYLDGAFRRLLLFLVAAALSHVASTKAVQHGHDKKSGRSEQVYPHVSLPHCLVSSAYFVRSRECVTVVRV